MASQAPSSNLNHTSSIPNDSKAITKPLATLYKQDPVSVSIDKEAVQAFGDDTYVPTQQGQNSSWTNLFSAQKWNQCKEVWKKYHANWRNLDSELAGTITNFKDEHILSLGDIRIRSVLMAFSSAVLYKSISWNTVGFLRKSRNMGISFVLTGSLFVPQLFNPFLQKSKASMAI